MTAPATLQSLAAKAKRPNGSAQAGRLLQRKCSCGGSASSLTGECEECSKKKLGLQTKLRVGAPEDVYEQEADRVARQVMSVGEASAASGPLAATRAVPRISRVADPPIARAGITAADARDSEPVEPGGVEEEEAKAPPAKGAAVQRKSNPDGSGAVSPNVEGALSSSLGAGGEPLQARTRSFMEPRFGHDFSAVRVFTKESDGRLARSLGARAFTTHQNIFFAPGEYQPGTAKGQELLAHELTHVVQQQGSSNRVSRKAELIQRAPHPCQAYAGYDKGVDVESYNCTGLAERNYKFLGMADTKALLAKDSPVDCAKGCAPWKIDGTPPQIQHWFWEYTMHLEDSSGAVLHIPGSPDYWKDFHTVGGMIDDKSSDMKQVYTKNGHRPVYGPDSGPAHKPKDKNQLRSNDKNDTPVTDGSGKPVYQVRQGITESCYCASCPKP